jgi:hypothetical protein
MLLALAVGALVGMRDRATARMMLLTVLIYGGGVVLANYWNTVADKPIQHGYLIGFGLIAATAGIMLIADWLTAARPVARPAYRPAERG